MRKIRIGNDVQVSWEVKTGGEAVPLEGRTLRVWVRSAYSRQEVESFSVDGCVITFTYPAEMQKTTGARAVMLEDMTQGSARRTLCADEAFQLVAHSSEEDCCGCEDGTEEDFGRYMVMLKSNVLVGKPGLSAYDLWLKDGHTGGMADYMLWLREPAETAAGKADEAEAGRAEAEARRAEAEAARTGKEAARNAAEEQRAASEAQRKTDFAAQMTAMDDKEEEVDSAVSEMKTEVSTAVRQMNEKTAAAVGEMTGTESAVKTAEAKRAEAENARAEAEGARQTAETKRTEAESGRGTAETLRTEAETARATAEQTRKTAEEQRQTSEAERAQSEQERVSAEQQRASAEQGRTTAEQQREDSEQARQAAEEQRQTAETDRNTTFSRMQTDTETAVRNCRTATEGAEKVNVELTGENISVTDRDGEVKTIQVVNQTEKVTVKVTTNVDGMSVEGIGLNVFLNNGKTPQTYTTDAEGKTVFEIDKGNYYEIAAPEYATAQPISPVGYTAVVPERTIELMYKQYDVDTSEKVVVTVTKYTDGTGVKWEGKTVKIAYDGKTTEYQCDANGQVTTYIPYLKEYTITCEDEDGYLVRFKKNTRTYTARVTQRLVDITMWQFKTGIFIVDKDGGEYYLDEWQASGKTSDEAVAIKIADQNLQQNRGSFMLRTSDLKDMTKLAQAQWCTQNLQFTSIALNGNTSSDANYWNGEQSTFLVMQEAEERSLSVPAFLKAHEATLEIGGQTLNGFLMSVGQEYVHISNAGVVRDILNAVFGDDTGTAYYKWVNSNNRWTSTQYTATLAWCFSSQASNNNKYLTYRVLPSFAC